MDWIFNPKYRLLICLVGFIANLALFLVEFFSSSDPNGQTGVASRLLENSNLLIIVVGLGIGCIYFAFNKGEK